MRSLYERLRHRLASHKRHREFPASRAASGVYAMRLDNRAGVRGTLRKLSPAGNFWQSMIHPQGDAVVYWGGSTTAQPWHIWLTPISTGTSVQLTNGAGTEGHPFWFPSGRRLVFFATAALHWDMARQFSIDRQHSSLWLLDITTGDRERLTTGPFIDERPAVSPDGREVLFVSNRSGRLNLWRVATDGTALEQVTGGDGPDYRPYFAPDARHIAYFTRGPDGTHQLVVRTWPDCDPLDFDSSRNFAWVHGPCWAADSRTILVHALARGESMPELWYIDIQTGAYERVHLDGVTSASHGSWDLCEKWLTFDCQQAPAAASTSCSTAMT